MKNYLYYVSILAFSVLLGGCLEDNEFATANISSAATIEVPSSKPYIFGATEAIDLTVELTEFSSASLVKSVSVIKSFNGTATTVADIDVGSITTFPTTLSFDLTGLLEGLSITESDLGPGDVWVFSYTVNLTDGRVLKPAQKTSIAFSCVSDLAGTYSSLTSGSAGTDDPYEVTLTETATSGVYEVSDITFGLYKNSYGASDNPADITDVCDVISLIDQPDVVYGGDVFNGSGTVNADGTITLSWSNGYGDYGVTTLTKQ
ncbi:hypothetical protein [Reichenbachiella sp. MALMAid0571]|uniref:hypothetical protein n=1 Tax=Reichenbachiella sp. MALMAid0571 TaxID=3143939 RepID=UPI0032DFD47C